MMWVLICEPRPSSRRPPEISCTSLAWTASDIGLRAKASAMAEPSLISVVTVAARVRATNGSCWVSAVHSAP